MQDGYVGDVGDFGKYLLLWNICSPADSDKKLKLGVNWYKVKNDGSYGKHIRYLRKDNFKLEECCNPKSKELYNKIQTLMLRNLNNEILSKLKNNPSQLNDDEWAQINENKKIEEISKREILPKDTVFYDKELQNTDRGDWVANGFEQLKECDVIFFDPDNGLKDDDGSNSVKHIYYHELGNDADKSLIIYHHATRKKIKEQAEEIKNKLSKKFDKNGDEIRALWYHRGTARLFFIIPNGTHKDIVTERIDRFLKNFENKKSNKEKHFERV